MHPKSREGLAACCRGSLGAGELGVRQRVGTACARSRRGTRTWGGVCGARGTGSVGVLLHPDGWGCLSWAGGCCEGGRTACTPHQHPAPHALNPTLLPILHPRLPQAEAPGSWTPPWESSSGCSLPGPEGWGACRSRGTIPCPQYSLSCPAHEDEFPLLHFIPCPRKEQTQHRLQGNSLGCRVPTTLGRARAVLQPSVPSPRLHPPCATPGSSSPQAGPCREPHGAGCPMVPGTRWCTVPGGLRVPGQCWEPCGWCRMPSVVEPST